MFDGQDMAHPRNFGLACHMGLLRDRPSIDCAKSVLYGKSLEPAPEADSQSRLLDPSGTALRTRTGVKPVYVPPGHRIEFKASADRILRTCRGYRLPEPTRQAHLLVNRRRKELMMSRNPQTFTESRTKE